MGTVLCAMSSPALLLLLLALGLERVLATCQCRDNTVLGDGRVVGQCKQSKDFFERDHNGELVLDSEDWWCSMTDISVPWRLVVRAQTSPWTLLVRSLSHTRPVNTLSLLLDTPTKLPPQCLAVEVRVSPASPGDHLEAGATCWSGRG